MTTEIIIAIISAAGTFAGAFLGVIRSASVTQFRLKQLEDKVSKHNNLIERVYILESESRCQHHDIEELQKNEEERNKSVKKSTN